MRKVQRRNGAAMNEILTDSVFFGVFLTLVCYQVGVLVKRKVKSALATPLLVAVILIIGILFVFKIDYDNYYNGAKYISYFLTPATVSLAVPLYRRMALLKEHPVAIFGGIASGVLTAMVSIFLLSLAFGLNHEQYVTLLPKSITTAIGMGVSGKIGGIPALTVVSISVTGVFGTVTAEAVCKLLGIKEPIAKGLAIGTASHALGTSKAMEIGEIEGAMSSLSIVVAGIMTVLAVQVFAGLI